MSTPLRTGLANLWRSAEHADAVVQFVLSGAGASDGAKRQRTNELPPGTPVGDPLPLHKLVMCLSSPHFAAALAGAAASAAGPAATGPAPAGALTVAGHGAGAEAGRRLLEIKVQVDGASELPAVLDALRYVYTGELESRTFAQLLTVRKYGERYSLAGCVNAADEAMAQCLSGGKQRALELFACDHLFPPVAGSGSEGGGRQASNAAAAGGFAGVLTAAQRQVVRHFGNAVEVLASPDLQAQWLALPPLGIEALLESDDFATDDESSVLLLFARWVSERHALRLPPLPGDPSLERLCRLVRLSQLGPAYLTFVLPYIPWFPISKPEMAFLLRYAAASDVPQGAPPGASQAPTATQLPYNTARKALAAAVAGVYDVSCAWYGKSRRQALPAGGLTLSWTVSREDLVQGIKSNTARHFYVHAMLEHPRIPRHTHAPPPGTAPAATGDPSPSGAAAEEGPGSKALALVGSEGAAGGSGSLGGSAPAAPPPAKMVTWRGLEWGVRLRLVRGSTSGAAGLMFKCGVPQPFARGGVAAGLAVPGAKLVVYRWRKGVREMGFSLDCSTEWENCSFNRCYGNSEALCLSQATQSQAEESTQGGTQAAVGLVGPGALVTTGVVPPKAGAGAGPGRAAELLEGWREYLHEGTVRGCVVLMP